MPQAISMIYLSLFCSFIFAIGTNCLMLPTTAVHLVAGISDARCREDQVDACSNAGESTMGTFYWSTIVTAVTVVSIECKLT